MKSWNRAASCRHTLFLWASVAKLRALSLEMERFNKEFENAKVPLKDLLYALRGITGDVFILDYDGHEEAITLNPQFRSTFHVADTANVDILMRIATDYRFINLTVCSRTHDLNGYQMQLLKGIQDSLHPYEQMTCTLFRDIEDPYFPLTGFMQLAKVKDLLENLRTLTQRVMEKEVGLGEIVNQICECCHSGNHWIRGAFRGIFRRFVDKYLQDLYLWLIYGKIENRVPLFIYDSSGEPQIQYEHWPNFTGTSLINTIYVTGKVSRLLRETEGLSVKSADHEFDLLRKELYLLKNEAQVESVSEKLQVFVKNIQRVISQCYAAQVLDSREFCCCLRLLKDFVLFGHETFWSCFLDNISRAQKDRDDDFILWDKYIERIWRSSVLKIFKDDAADRILGCLSIACSAQDSKDDLPMITFKCNFHPHVDLVLRGDLWNDYDRIVNLLFRLHKARMDISTLWLLHIKNRNQSLDVYLLRHRLTLILDRLYFFWKVTVIERLYEEHYGACRSCKSFNDIGGIHQKFTSSLLDASFLRSNNLEAALHELFDLCTKICNSGDLDACSTEKYQKTLKQICYALHLIFRNPKSNQSNAFVSPVISLIDLCITNSHEC